MDTFLNEAKLKLIEFFKKHEKFKVFHYGKKDQKDTFLYNVRNQNFQIIHISNEYTGIISEFKFDDPPLNDLIDHIKKNNKHLEPKTLHIILSQSAFQKIEKKEHTIVMANADWAQQLLSFFPNLKNFEKPSDIDLSKMDKQELSRSLSESNSQFSKKLQDIQSKMRPSNLILIWVVLILFILIPIFLYFLRGTLGFSAASASAFQLLMGGVNRDFLVGFNQWWRLFTFPFANDNLFTLLIFGIMLYYVCKALEISLKPWKTVVTIVFGTPLSILLLAVAMPTHIFAGIAPLVAMLYGLLFFTHYKSQNLTAVVAKSTTIAVPVLLILIPLFTQNYALYLVYFIGFITGVFFGFLFSYDFKHIDWTIIIPIIIFIGLFIVPWILMYTNTYWPANNNDVFSTLQFYYNAKWMSKNTISSVLEHYYHIPSGDLGNYITF